MGKSMIIFSVPQSFNRPGSNNYITLSLIVVDELSYLSFGQERALTLSDPQRPVLHWIAADL